ncbi:MAG: prolipoprotein diacylglyceryl transferase [Desulfotignum sp.]|nr:prolipoprotein diacylglyceryl transferase [Desulfotignum sp.]
MNYFTWNVDPVIFAIGPLQPRWYGLLFALAFILGYHLMQWMYTREKMPRQNLDLLSIYLIAGTIIGARLGHCLFYDPSYYLGNPLKILAVWEGGLASHGGGIGVLISLYLYTVKTGESYLWLLDRIAIPACLAGVFIRLGNFFNSEIVGFPASVPWAVIFQRVDALPRHPAQLYEALAYFLIFFILLSVYKSRKKDTRNGAIFGTFLVLVFVSRILVEFVKTPQAAYPAAFWLNTGQMLSIPFVVAGMVFLVKAFRGK